MGRRAPRSNKTSSASGSGQPTKSADDICIYEVHPGQDGNMYRVEFVNNKKAWVMIDGMSFESQIYHVSCTEDELNNFAYDEPIVSVKIATPKKKGGYKKKQ